MTNYTRLRCAHLVATKALSLVQLHLQPPLLGDCLFSLRLVDLDLALEAAALVLQTLLEGLDGPGLLVQLGLELLVHLLRRSLAVVVACR